MSNKNYICSAKKFIYEGGYIALPIEVGELPESINVEGVSLEKKSSFHVSLFCVKHLLEKLPDVEQKTLDFFCSFVKENDISFIRFTDKFRFAQSDERKTVIALCEISNLKKLSEALGQELGIKIQSQPTHVTLYTLQPDFGIGLNSSNDIKQKSIPTQVSDKVKRSLDLL